MPVLKPAAEWRLVLCDRLGVAIAQLTTRATGKTLAYRLNRPAQCSFSVPSDDPLVNMLFDDGHPYLCAGRRTVKAYRRVRPTSAPSPWTLRFVGPVWSTQDQGDGDSTRTAVSCFDGFKKLTKRRVRDDSAHGYSYRHPVIFSSQAGAQIAKKLVERTNDFASAAFPTGIVTTGSFANTHHFPQTYPIGSLIAPSIVSLCNTGTMDVIFTPVDATDGTLAEMSVVAKRGSHVADAIFGYAVAPHTASDWDRTESMDTFANDVWLHGGPGTKPEHRADTDSQDDFGLYEETADFSQVHKQSYLSSLADEEIAFRALPQEFIKVTPLAELSPLLFDEYFLGDWVQVRASNLAREALVGEQRVHGVTVSVDDDGVERLGTLDVTPEASD